MKLLVILRNCWYIRNFERTLRYLLEQGHTVEIWFLAHKKDVPREQVERLAADYPDRVIYHPKNKPKRKDAWAKPARKMRKARNYLRYLAPEYANTPLLAERAGTKLPKRVRFFSQTFPLLRIQPIRRWYMAQLAQREEEVPPAEKLVDIIRETKADALMISPMIDHDSFEVDYLKAARSLGMPTCVCIASWDNLTNKGLILSPPDRVTVWNEAMRQEAIKLHHIPAEKVVATGAQIFDPWFEQKLTRERADFCQALGFEAGKPILLYLCSSPFIGGEECEFVDEWIREVRASGLPGIAEANLLVRPHPLNAGIWEGREPVDPLERSRVWPRAGEHNINEDARANYYDTLYHSAAITGINTSGLVEAAIVGRPCLSILTPKYEKTQTGTLHFQHLIEGGFLSISSNWDDYRERLADVLERPDHYASLCRDFTRDFIRPHGLDKPAAPRLAKAILELSEAKEN